MRIECPSCNYFADVSNKNVPTMGGNTKCPRCSTVFFVAPTEPETPEIPFARINCPKCGFEQELSETCANCGLIYAKHRTAVQPITQTASVLDRQRVNQKSHRTFKFTEPFDMFQGLLLLCGAVATVYSLKRGIDLMALEEKFRGKYHLIPSKMGFLNRAYFCVLPTIAIAETIFLVLIVYSYKKRTFLSQHGTYGDFGVIHRNEVNNSIRNIGLFVELSG